MDLKAILTSAGLEGDKLTEALNLIETKLNDEIKLKEEVYKNKVNKEVEKYKDLEKDFTNYKQDIENQKIKTERENFFKNELKTAGINDKIISLLLNTDKLKDVDINNSEAWQNKKNELIEEYKPFISEVVTVGAEPTTPPEPQKNEEQDPFLKGFMEDY